MTSRTASYTASHIESQFFLPRPTFAEQLQSLVLPLVQNLWFWLARSKSRRDLMQLDGRLLRDIGVNWVDAQREAAKPFWEE